MTSPSDTLARLIASELETPVSAGTSLLVERIRERLGDGVRAILFYGSCLRTGDDQYSLLDLYVLVDNYWSLRTSRFHACLNALLPPNVYYIEVPDGERTVRAKYAVVSLTDFARYTSQRAFQAYFWGRFAQRCALLYAADPVATQAVTAAVSSAVTTFVRRGLPLVPERCSIEELWTTQLTHSYRAEVRAERQAVAGHLYATDAQRYERVTHAALARLPFPVTTEAVEGRIWVTARLRPSARALAVALWRIRRWYGKLLSLLRILKSAITQEGSVDYAIWKVERHSGIRVDPTWRQKRHPLLALGQEVWQMYRKGAFR
jgi:predicted nucleotidyltransferase